MKWFSVLLFWQMRSRIALIWIPKLNDSHDDEQVWNWYGSPPPIALVGPAHVLHKRDDDMMMAAIVVVGDDANEMTHD